MVWCRHGRYGNNSEHLVFVEFDNVLRLLVHRRNDVLERSSSTFCPVSTSSGIGEGPSWSEYTLLVFRHVARDFRLAC